MFGSKTRRIAVLQSQLCELKQHTVADLEEQERFYADAIRFFVLGVEAAAALHRCNAQERRAKTEELVGRLQQLEFKS